MLPHGQPDHIPGKLGGALESAPDHVSRLPSKEPATGFKISLLSPCLLWLGHNLNIIHHPREVLELHEHNEDVIQVNLELGESMLMEEHRRTFLEIFETAIQRILSGCGLRNFQGIEEDFIGFKDNIAHLKEDLKNADKYLKEKLFDKEEIGAEDRLATLIDNLNSNMAKKLKVISRCVGGLENDYENLLHQIQEMFYKLVSSDEPGLLEKYSLNDLLLISKNKLASSCNSVTIMRKDITKLGSNNKVLTKKNEKLIKEVDQLRTRKKELEESVEQFKKSLETVSADKSMNEHEISSHIQLVKVLQEENRTVNLKMKEIEGLKDELELTVERLKNDKKKLEDCINEMDSNNICALRQERLKLEQAKRDLGYSEDKNKDLEIMLKAENAKYESLYKKYLEIQRKSQSQVNGLSTLKRITSSFDTKDRSLNKSGNNDSNNSRHNASLNHKKSLPSEFALGAKKTASNEEVETLKSTVEDLNLKVITTEVQLATERNVFAQLIAEQENEKKMLNEVG